MRTTRIISAPLAVVLAAGALAAPATARIDPPADWTQPGTTAQTETTTPRPTVSIPASGFDWGSWAIGAAAGIGASAIAVAGTAGMRRRSVVRQRSVPTH
jgi:hypothetical protein